MIDFPPTKYWCFPYRSGNCTSQTKTGFSTHKHSKAEMRGFLVMPLLFVFPSLWLLRHNSSCLAQKHERMNLFCCGPPNNQKISLVEQSAHELQKRSWTARSPSNRTQLNDWCYSFSRKRITSRLFPRRHKLFEKHQRQRHLCIYWPWIPGVKFHVSDILRYSFEVSEVHLIDIACRLCDRWFWWNMVKQLWSQLLWRRQSVVALLVVLLLFRWAGEGTFSAWRILEVSDRRTVPPPLSRPWSFCRA